MTERYKDKDLPIEERIEDLLSRMALEAGLDVELPNSECFGHVTDLVGQGALSEDVIDASVRRILRCKFWLGLFDDPFVDPAFAERICDCQEHRELALEAARKSIVLLKNDGILPLNRKAGSVAVIGPNADVARLGGYSGFAVELVTPLDGIRSRAGRGAGDAE